MYILKHITYFLFSLIFLNCYNNYVKIINIGRLSNPYYSIPISLLFNYIMDIYPLNEFYRRQILTMIIYFQTQYTYDIFFNTYYRNIFLKLSPAITIIMISICICEYTLIPDLNYILNSKFNILYNIPLILLRIQLCYNNNIDI